MNKQYVTQICMQWKVVVVVEGMVIRCVVTHFDALTPVTMTCRQIKNECTEGMCLP